MIPSDPAAPLSVIYCGSLLSGTTSHKRCETLARLAGKVSAINTTYGGAFEHFYFRTGNRIDILGLNLRLVRRCREQRPDIVWFDKATKIGPWALRRIGKAGTKLVHVNPDDPFGVFNRGWSMFLRALPHYDVHFVARAANVSEYVKRGAPCVHTYDRSFDPSLHRPLAAERVGRGPTEVRIGFVGSWAVKRSDSLAYLAANGIRLAIWGNGWKGQKNWNVLKEFYEGPGTYGEKYVERLNSLDIALHFLREENRDEQDSRTYEIPACRRFMLAERSAKHLELFKEGEEAEFFSTDPELLAKVREYARNPAAIDAIAQRGYARAIANYSHEHRLADMLKLVIAHGQSGSGEPRSPVGAE